MASTTIAASREVFTVAVRRSGSPPNARLSLSSAFGLLSTGYARDVEIHLASQLHAFLRL